MPVARLVAGEWLPDRGELNNSGLVQVYGAIPRPDGYGSAPFVVTDRGGADFEAVTAAQYFGFHIHAVEDSALNSQDLYFFAGNLDDLFRSDAANSLTMELATAAPSAFNPSVASGWQFVSYGDTITATDFRSHIQYAATPTTDFVDLVEYTTPDSYRPKARFVSTIKQHLLIGNIQFGTAPSATITASALNSTVYPSMVMWSATDNIRRFGDPAATPDVLLEGADYQILADEYGAVSGLVGGDYAYIFKERAIYRMDGPPFSFHPVCLGTGTIYPNSIVKYYDDIYFWADGGPVVLRGGSSVPEQIGKGRIQRTLLNRIRSEGDVDIGASVDEAPTYYMEKGVNRAIDICGFADYRAGNIVFTALNRYTVPPDVIMNSKFLVYNVATDRFGFFNTNTFTDIIGPPVLFPKSISMYQYDKPDTPYLAPLSVNVSLDEVHQGVDFNGTYFITGETDTVSTGATVGMFAEDATLASGVGDTDQQQVISKPTFSWGYVSFPISEGGETQVYKASRITKMRPIFLGLPLNYTITVKSVSRFPIRDNTNVYTSSVTYTPNTDTYQDDNGWVSLESVYATHHKITIQFSNPVNEVGDGNPFNDAAYASNFVTLEVEYDLADKYGGAVLA